MSMLLLLLSTEGYNKKIAMRKPHQNQKPKGPPEPAMAGRAGGARRLVDAFPYKILARAAAGVMKQHSEKSWGSCVLENITNEHKNGLNRAMSGGTPT